MRFVRILVIAVMTALLGGVASAAVPKGEAPKATDVGITADEIRLAVVADVDNALVPGFFAGAVAGVQGAAKYLNANGGIAGRKVVIDFIDSHLSADEARNAVITACANDFALVGTSALFLNNVDDMTACADRKGAPTGIPDLSLVTTEAVQVLARGPVHEAFAWNPRAGTALWCS